MAEPEEMIHEDEDWVYEEQCQQVQTFTILTKRFDKVRRRDKVHTTGHYEYGIAKLDDGEMS